MARRPVVNDEQKSYATVFLLAVGLLLLGTIWAVWDDNIVRRPWKQYQLKFHRLEVDRVRQGVAAEQGRLDADPEYQKVAQELTQARASLDSGENARRLTELQRQREKAQVRVDELDFDLRLVKSRLEEAWYEYDHAVLSAPPTDPGSSLPVREAKAVIAELDRQKAEIDASLEKAQGETARIDSEVAEVRSVVQNLEKKQRELEAPREGLSQKLDGLLLRLGPFEFTKVPKIQQIVLNEFDRNAYDQPVARVERCESCHTGINKVGFENDPNPHKTHPRREEILGKHPPESFGCTPCHGGQGAAVNSPDKAHGRVKFWEHPLLPGDMVQSNCIGCHHDLHKPGADAVARGEHLFEQLGCHGCHLIEGYGELAKVGPYLRRIAAKLDPEWLVRWVENPHAVRPHTKMPTFLFNREQATAIAGFLLKTSAAESEAWLASHPSTNGHINPSGAAQVKEGQALVNSLGCRGCHGFADGESPAVLGEDKDIAPNLSAVASKTNAQWLYHWLKNPRGYSPVARMPSLRLSDQEAAAVASYLLTLGTRETADADLLATLQAPETIKSGEGLVRKYGCGGCHDIPGMEAESRIGVELSVYGDKLLEELFFGHRTDVPVTWYDWTYHKLETPRTYQTERIEQLMPQFDLSDADIKALLVFLKSRSDHEVPTQYRPADSQREQRLVEGRRVVARYNCVGCHVIEQRGGAILARYQDTPTLAPPVLNGEGGKVQAAWLFGFLKQPVPVRPWLKIRMPTFGLSDEETSTLAEYFLAQEKIDVPFVHVNMAAIPAAHVEAGKVLMSEDYFNCFSCHQQGDKKPEGPEEGWAPDLAMAKERLNPEWIVRWLTDPQVLQPGTKMPSFYPGGPEDVLGGDEKKQIEALRDYILTLHGGGDALMAAADRRAAAAN